LHLPSALGIQNHAYISAGIVSGF